MFRLVKPEEQEGSKKLRTNLMSRLQGRSVVELSKITWNVIEDFWRQVKKLSRITADPEMLWTKGFLSWHRRPLDHKWSTLVAQNQTFGHVAIVVQGPLRNARHFTLNTLRTYQQLFPDAAIVLSTWVGENEKEIAAIKNLGIIVVQSVLPEFKGPLNLNLQRVSTQAGLRVALELNPKRILKTRTDQRIYSPDALSIFEALLNLNSLWSMSGSERNIVVTADNSFLGRPFSASDFLQYGASENIEKFWFGKQHDFEGLTVPEQILTISYLKNSGFPLDAVPSHENWEKAIREVFAFADMSQLDMMWFKYDSREYSYKVYGDSVMSPITQSKWIGESFATR